MKKLIKTILLFVSPIMVYMVALEIIVSQIPNSYSYKYGYVKMKGQSIEAIAMGHSQLYDGFYPQHFYLPAFNLSNSNQTFEDDYYLLEELLPYMPNLKLAIFPIGYFDVGINEQEEGITDRSRYYHKYMHIDYDGRLPLKYMYECLNPRLATNKVFQYYFQHVDMVGCDSLGTRNNHYLKNRTDSLGYGKFNRYTVPVESNMFIRDWGYLKSILQLLEDLEIKVILVSPPYYWNEYNGINNNQKKYVKKAINSLSENYNFIYVDMEDDTTFVYDDYYDETHLNEYGGEKFTKRLNTIAGKNISLK